MDNRGRPPPLDEQLDALAHVERRRLLRSLLDEETRDIDGLSGQGPGMRAERRDRLIALHHCHLPKLEAHGIIEWDRERQAVARGSRFEDVRPLLELLAAYPHELPAGSD